MSLVQIQSAVKNRIHATLHRHGILHEYSDLFGKAGREFLQALVAEDDVTLRVSTRRTLKGHLELLCQVREQIAAATHELRRQVVQDPDAEIW